MNDPEEDLVLNPSSPIYNNDTEFDSSDLYECFEYYKATGNEEPLLNCIQIKNAERGYTIDRINRLIDYFETTDNTFVLSNLGTIKKLI